MSCSKDLWDSDENLPKKKHPLYKEMVISIAKKKLEANKLVLDLSNDEKDVSAEEIRSKLKTSVVNKKTVFQYFDEVIARLKATNRLGYAGIFKSTKNSLVTFRNGKDFQFSDITTSFLTKYEDAFYVRGVAPNSVFVFLRTFKTLVNYARKDSIVKSDFDPFKELNFTKFRRIRTKKRAVSKEDIQKIEKLKIKDDQGLLNARNYFLFSYYNRGINFIDIAYLKWDDVKNGRLVYTRRKTKEDFTIALLPPAIKILDYYKKLTFEDNDSYIFPILSATYKTPQSIRNRLVKMLRIVNQDLKAVGEKAKISEKLTTYVARHSFATNLKKSGISTSVISEAMGHDSEKTTKIYLDSFANDILDEASKALL
jgi:site-specific recombinase XerD